MPKTTLLIYIHALAGGGAERVCAVLARGFHAIGWRVVVAVDRPDSSNLGFLGEGIDIRVLGANHAASTLALARLLRREKPDISLSALAASNLKHTVAAVLAGRRRRAVLSYHAFASSEPQRLSQLGYRALFVLSRVAARTIAVSNLLRQDLVARWHASSRRTVTVYNPVQVGTDRSRLPPDGGPLVLSAGRLVPDKNMTSIVRAFAAVAPVFGARLAIIGEGPDRPAIEAEVARLGLGDRVELPGYLTEPWAYYRQAACFVTASRLEAFSMVVAEALAYGVPVVATDTPGPREVLDHGRYGLLVPPDDEAALAEALRTVLRSPDGGEAARLRSEQLSSDAGVAAYERLFRQVMAEA